MQAGKLRHRVTIQQRSSGSPQNTPSGAPDEAWTDLATVWGSIESLKGREFLEAQSIQSQISVRIRIRYLAGVTAGMRATHAGKVYNIDAPLDLEERHIEMHLMCSEGSSNG